MLPLKICVDRMDGGCIQMHNNKKKIVLPFKSGYIGAVGIDINLQLIDLRKTLKIRMDTFVYLSNFM